MRIGLDDGSRAKSGEGFASVEDEALGVRSEKSAGVVRRYRCGCSLVRVGRRVVEQGCLTCPGGDEHARVEVGELGPEDQRTLF